MTDLHGGKDHPGRYRDGVHQIGKSRDVQWLGNL
jgi:hypothetical protein